MKKDKLIKSRQRVADYGEVFTPPKIVADMLALVESKVKNIESRFLEPACGDGNFLAAILDVRLDFLDKKYRYHQPEWERQAFFAVSSLYGIELLQDNVERCRKRLFEIFSGHYKNFSNKNNKFKKIISFVLRCNIVQGNTLSMCRSKGCGEDLPLPIVFYEWNTYQNNQLIRKKWIYQDLIKKNRQDGGAF